MSGSDSTGAKRRAEAEALMDQGYDLLDRNNFPAALKVGRQLEQRRYSGGFEIQGRALMAMGRRKQAIAVLERGVENVPGNWSLWQGLGNYRSDDGDYEGAFAAYERSLACDCDLASVTYNYVQALIRAGQWEEAEARIMPLFETEAVRRATPRLGLYLVNAYEDILRNSGREEEAIAIVESHADVVARAALDR